MSIRRLVLLLCLLVCTHVHAAGLLFVGAHPDDESYVAPLLYDVCVVQDEPCHFLILTRGEHGKCLLPGQCLPSLAVWRTSELWTSTGYFGATFQQLDLGDTLAGTPNGVLANWIYAAGGSAALETLIADVIIDLEPEVIVTFDTRHGSTCHADHRAAATLLLQVADNLNYPASAIYMMEGTSVVGIVNGEPWFGFRPVVAEDAALEIHQANWHAVADVLDIYRTQFDPVVATAADNAISSARIVPLLRLSAALDNDPRYANLCTE